MSPSVLSFVNCKGGVGKTSISVNVAAMLGKSPFDKRVLLLDLDSQCSATIWLMGLEPWKELIKDNNHKTVYQLFHDKLFKGDFFDFEEAVIQCPKAVQGTGINLDLLPGSRDIRELEDILWQQAVNSSWPITQILKRSLKPYMDRYDVVVIDCPPNTYRVTQNAVAMSDHLIVPAKPDYLSLVGFEDLAVQLHELGGLGPSKIVPISAIVINEYRGYLECDEGVSQLEISLQKMKNLGAVPQGCFIFSSKISGSTVCAKMARRNKPIFLGTGAKAIELKDQYEEICKEIQATLI